MSLPNTSSNSPHQRKRVFEDVQRKKALPRLPSIALAPAEAKGPNDKVYVISDCYSSFIICGTKEDVDRYYAAVRLVACIAMVAASLIGSAMLFI